MAIAAHMMKQEEKENEKNVIDGTVRLYGIVPGGLRRLRENGDNRCSSHHTGCNCRSPR